MLGVVLFADPDRPRSRKRGADQALLSPWPLFSQSPAGPPSHKRPLPSRRPRPSREGPSSRRQGPVLAVTGHGMSPSTTGGPCLPWIPLILMDIYMMG